MSRGGTPVRAAAAVLDRVLVRPVVEGRPRLGGPAGYSAMVVLALLGVVLTLGCALLAPVLRARLPLTPTQVGIDAPPVLVGLLVGVLVLALALVHTAALHAHPGWRLAGVALAVVYLAAVTPLGYLADQRLVLVAAATTLVTLVVLQLVRWRRRSAWWELVVVLLAYAGTTMLALGPSLRAGTILGLGDGIEALWLLLQRIAPLAGPVVLVASVATTQVGLRAAAWTVRGVRALAPGWVAFVLCLVVLLFRLVVDVLGWIDTWEFSGTRIAAGAGLLTAAALVWGLTRAAGRRMRAAPLVHLTGDLTTVAIPLAVAVLLGSMVQLVLDPVSALLLHLGDVSGRAGPGTAGAAVATAATAASGFMQSRRVVLVVVAVLVLAATLLAARGWDGPSGLVAVLAVVHGTEQLWGLEVPLYYLPLVLTGLTAVALVVVLLRGRLTTRRLEALTLIGLLTTLLAVRGLLGDALTLLVGGTVAVVASLVWAFLTGASSTAELPGRRVRASWFLGYSLLGFVVVAFAALGANPDATYDAEATADAGVALFGTALVLTAVIACAVAVIRDRDLGDLG